MKTFCGILRTYRDTKKLELNQSRNYDKTPSMIYADLESLIMKIDGCKNNIEKSSTRKVIVHINYLSQS